VQGDGPGGLRIGLAWAGNPRYKADRTRSMELNTLFPLLRSVDAIWISLQKGEAAAQLAGLPEDVRVLDGCSGDRDLAETAAVIAALDLVITTDTCIAHLAGAMGKPVWILLPHLSDWRWMQETQQTPWYPTARLFRQHVPGDWAEVVERVSGVSGVGGVSELASRRVSHLRRGGRLRLGLQAASISHPSRDKTARKMEQPAPGNSGAL
jgi:hypothetical protein